MMRLLFIGILLVLTHSSEACKCRWITIEEAYTRADVIFYGKHKGTVDAPRINNIHGKPSKFEQFTVKRFYKGGSDAFSEAKGDFTISLRSTCDNSCGMCYDSGSYYLVYANVLNQNMFLETEICSRSRIIENNKFMVPTSIDPDAGKDEAYELVKFSRNDTTSMRKSQTMMAEMEEERWVQIQKQLKKKTSMTIILSTTTLILLIYVVLDWFKKKKAA
jgi:hypothetical protein